MRIHCILMMLVFGFITTPAQTGLQALVAIELGPETNQRVPPQLQIPVFHQFDDVLIAALSPEQQQYLTDAGVRLTVLDDPLARGGYLLLSKKEGAMRAAEADGCVVLYEKQGTYIVRGTEGDQVRLAARNIRSAALRATMRSLEDNDVLKQPVKSALVDSLIAVLTTNVNPDTVRWFIEGLTSFGSHHYRSANRHAVAEWIQAAFRRMGFADVVLDTFMANGYEQTNVIATLPSSSATEDVIVIGGHHDTVGWRDSTGIYPGADDNSSGTAAVLESARALTRAGYKPRMTLRFITFAAEEAGLLGSRSYAQRASQSGMKIRLMINHDMIANSSLQLEDDTVRVYYYTGAESYRELAKTMTQEYTMLTPVDGNKNSGGSDSYSFYSVGYPAVYFFEKTFSPWYHSTSDIIANCNIPYCAEIIRASVATLLYTDIAGPVTGVDASAPITPVSHALLQNFPNPFNPSTTITYELPRASHVTLGVYDVLGRQVEVLVNDVRDAGRHEVRFDGTGLSNGVYFYRLQTDGFLSTRRMLLTK